MTIDNLLSGMKEDTDHQPEELLQKDRGSPREAEQFNFKLERGIEKKSWLADSS